MNIFVLDRFPRAAAAALCDAHVVKMATETVQILCTVAHARGFTAPWKPTHERHPCVAWAGEGRNNFAWTYRHAVALCSEYVIRYGKTHAAEAVLLSLGAGRVHDGVPPGSTLFVQAMPEKYRGPDAVAAYRRYYRGEKVWQKRQDGRRIRLARWERGRAAPSWWLEDD